MIRTETKEDVKTTSVKTVPTTALPVKETPKVEAKVETPKAVVKKETHKPHVHADAARRRRRRKHLGF